jgi:hypothetical protein
VITAGYGPLRGQRVVRGREDECRPLAAADSPALGTNQRRGRQANGNSNWISATSAVSSSPLSRAKVSRSNFIFDGGRNRVLADDVFRRKHEI